MLDEDIVLDNKIRREVKEEILKYLDFTTEDQGGQTTLKKSKTKINNARI